LYDTTVGSGFPDDELSRALRRLARTGGLLEPHDHAGLRVSLSEVMALAELDPAGAADRAGLAQQDLAARLGLEKSTVSRLAAALERRGWLTRERDPGNRRYYRLRLTPEGADVAARIGADLTARHARLLGALTPKERAGLALGLAGLARAVEQQDRHGSRPGPE
jgi:DNA-binding MarR family transcriptional regulator